MIVNKNKIEDLEKKVIWKQTEDKLLTALDPLLLWLEDMKITFFFIFDNKKWDNKITISMDNFEKKWNK
jgi:hypothetical protein